uniref:Uncharacterized protein n=1 Tax=viral metagenome TaxID=1070528 RepID=A0A6C0B4L5_9ZZZZ
MSYYYGGYPYGYGYPYSYPYSLPLLANDYKLAGLYNELDELNDVEAKYSREFDPNDVSMNHGLHTQLKDKNYELVQHIVKKDIEINELKSILKTHNIQHTDVSNNDTTPKGFYPYGRYPYGRYPYGRYPYYPYGGYPYYPYGGYPYGGFPYRYRDGPSEPHSVNPDTASHMIVPRAMDPNSQDMHYIIPPHPHFRTCGTYPPPPPMPQPEPEPMPPMP